MNAKELIHDKLIPFELTISQLGIRGRIDFEEAILSAMTIYAEAKAKEAWNAAIDAAAEGAEVVYDEDMVEWVIYKQSILNLKK